MRRDKRVLVSEFQFHKVRLKALPRIGSIYYDGFQFHKVRLKDVSSAEKKKQETFQFHKVRLKASRQT